MLKEELRRMDGEYQPDATPAPSVAPAVLVHDGPSVKDAFEKYMEASRYRRKHTQGQIRATAQAFLDHAHLLWPVSVGSITKSQCVSFKDAEVASGMKSATVNRKLSYLGHFFKWCEGRDYLKANPTSRRQDDPHWLHRDADARNPERH